MIKQHFVPASRRMLIVFFALVTSSAVVLGQSIPINGSLYGNPITYAGPGTYGIVATPQGLYETLGGFGSYYTNLWKPPQGRRIANAASKAGSGDVLVILLDDGSVYEGPSNSKTAISSVTYLGKVGSAGSESFSKIVGDALYMLSSSYVYVTRDTGKTWKVDSAGLSGAHAWDVALDSAQRVYAATTIGLYYEHPDSNVWHKVTAFTLNSSLYKMFVDRKNRILVGGNGGGLYLGTSNGNSWSSDTAGIGNVSVNLMADDAYGNLYVVTRDVFANIDHIYKSANGTSPWQLIDGTLNSITVSNAAIISLAGDSILVAGTTFGLFASTDQGGTWTQHNNGIAAELFNGFVRSSAGTWLTSDALGIFSKNPNDTSWTKRFPVNGYQGGLPITGDGLGNIYTTTGTTTPGGPIVFKSTDNGASWNPDTVGVSLLRTGVFFIDEAGGQHLGTSQYGSSFTTLLYTKPLGGSWTLDTAGFASTNYSFTSSGSSDKHGSLYITGYYHNGNGGPEVNARSLRRPIAGGPWTPDTAGLGTVNYLSNFGPDKAGNMMGEAGSSIYRHSAGTWSKVSLPTQAVSNFYSPGKFSVDSSGAIFLSFTNFNGGRGVYFTTDGGTSWTFAGLDSLSITKMISYGDSTFVSTTNGLYILRRQAYGTSGVTSAATRPDTYALFQNYPNPFNPSTTITYQLPITTHVSLKIFDLLGREVATLVDGEMNAGKHATTFDASRFASGIYFYRFSAGTFTATKKLMLLK